MAGYFPICTIKDARYCLEQVRSMLERARSMWSQANKTVEETKTMRADLEAQIKELAKHGAFRRQLAATLLPRILDAAIESTGADMGNIQVFGTQAGQLLILLQRGFDEPFLRFFNSVHIGQAACGTALKLGQRVIVPDVACSPIFPDADCLEVMLDAGVRAVQSTPLIAKSGRIWGMLSTHYRNVNHPGLKDLRLIDYFADWAAEILEAVFQRAKSRNKTIFSSGNGAETRPLPSPRETSIRLLPIGGKTRIG